MTCTNMLLLKRITRARKTLDMAKQESKKLFILANLDWIPFFTKVYIFHLLCFCLLCLQSHLELTSKAAVSTCGCWTQSRDNLVLASQMSCAQPSWQSWTAKLTVKLDREHLEDCFCKWKAKQMNFVFTRLNVCKLKGYVSTLLTWSSNKTWMLFTILL